ELYPIRDADFAGEAGGANGLVGRIATGGIWGENIFFWGDVVEQGFLAAVEIHAAHRDPDHFCAAGLPRAGCFLKRFVFSRAHDETGAQLTTSDDEWIRHAPYCNESGRKRTKSVARDVIHDGRGFRVSVDIIDELAITLFHGAAPYFHAV